MRGPGEALCGGHRRAGPACCWSNKERGREGAVNVGPKRLHSPLLSPLLLVCRAGESYAGKPPATTRRPQLLDRAWVEGCRVMPGRVKRGVLACLQATTCPPWPAASSTPRRAARWMWTSTCRQAQGAAAWVWACMHRPAQACRNAATLPLPCGSPRRAWPSATASPPPPSSTGPTGGCPLLQRCRRRSFAACLAAVRACTSSPSTPPPLPVSLQ
jgi:hypothetical protein